MEQKIPLLEIGPVAASKTVTIRLEQLIGRRLKALLLAHGYAGGTNTIAAAASNITEIRFIANDRVLRRGSGTQLRDLLLLNGTSYDYTGVPNTAPGVTIPMFFSEPWRQDRDQRDITAFPTRWGGKNNPVQQLDGLRLELDLGAAGTPTLVAFAIVDDVVPDVAAPMSVEYVPISMPAGSTQFDFSIPRTGILNSLSLYPDSGGTNAATRVKLVVDEVTRHDLTNTANTAFLLTQLQTPAASGRTANVYDIVPDHDDNLSLSIPLGSAKSAVLTITAGGAMSGTVTGMAQLIKPII